MCTVRITSAKLCNAIKNAHSLVSTASAVSRAIHEESQAFLGSKLLCLRSVMLGTHLNTEKNGLVTATKSGTTNK